MKIKHVALLFAAYLLLGFSSPAIAADTKSGTASGDIPAFGSVVARNWDKWSGKNPSVTKLDLIAQIAKPEYRGEDAAALAALERYLRKVPSIDKAAAVSLQDNKTLELYGKNVLKLRGAKRELFAPGQPDFNTMAQGPAGDCYFFSGTGWIAKYRRVVIIKAIKQLPDKTYRVDFPGGDSAVVTAPTDAEMAVNDSASTLKGGLWMSILEKALGVILSRTNARASAIPDPTVAIDIPGVKPASIIKLWTGNTAEVFSLSKVSRPKLKDALRRMHERGSMTEALLLKRNSSHLPWDHVYAVMDFDSKTEKLTMWNPLAYDFKPSGPDGMDNGYTSAHGIFNMPLDDFMSIYSYVMIEKN